MHARNDTTTKVERSVAVPENESNVTCFESSCAFVASVAIDRDGDGNSVVPPLRCDSVTMLDNIRRELSTDADWEHVIGWVTGKVLPATVRQKNIASQYVFKRGLLYRWVTGETGAMRQALVVPSGLRSLALHNAHDVRVSGHQGVARTYKRLRGRYYWNTMLRDVKDYVSSCTTCASMKSSSLPPMGFMRPMPTSLVPFERVAIDKFGSIANASDGSKYVLIAIDFCTRFVVATTMSDGLAATAARFMKGIILDHYPSVVQSDNCPEFAAEFAELLRCAGIKHVHSTPRHPRSNGMIERANKSITEIMRTLIEEPDHSDWPSVLQHAVRCYNTSVHDVTGFSPYFLLYGSEPRVGPLLNEEPILDDTSDAVLVDIGAMRSIASERTKAHQRRQRRWFNRKRRRCVLCPGDLVMVEASIFKKGQSSRFNPRRRGPYDVVEVNDNNTVVIADSDGIEAVVNVERCTQVMPRRSDLMFDNGLSDVIESVIRGPDLLNGEAEDAIPVSEISIDADDAQPLRRSQRTRRAPDRLQYDVMMATSESAWDSVLAAELSTLFPHF